MVELIVAVVGATLSFEEMRYTKLNNLFRIDIITVITITRKTVLQLIESFQQFITFNMDPTFEEVAVELGQPRKKQKKEVSPENEWIVVKSKQADLTISICDFSRVNRFYSHRSIQSYLRYLLTQSVPNPMWLAIKRQSQIEQILYIDLEIESTLFEKMVNDKQLPFLATKAHSNNTALFKFNNKIFREQLWECLLCCENEQNIQEIQSQKHISQMSQHLDEQLFKKYQKYVLTPQELKSHLYPSKQLPIYFDFYELKTPEQAPQIPLKNKILIVDCEMVLSQAGFELARATIVNFQGQMVYDELFKPEVEIINYNTIYSGITKEMIQGVTNTVHNNLYPFLEKIMTKDTILVGHSLQNDLRAMKLIHNKVIDTSVLFMRKNGTKFKLKVLADKILNRKIQVGEHDSKEDCLATLHLVRGKIEHDEQLKKKDYQVLQQIQDAKKSIALIDHAIDYEMKAFNANHYEKTQVYQKPSNLFRIVKKYLRRDVSIPDLVLSRIEKHPDIEWEDHYKQLDLALKDLFEVIPKKTAIFLNCQVNPKITLMVAGEPMKLNSNIRCPCYMLAV